MHLKLSPTLPLCRRHNGLSVVGGSGGCNHRLAAASPNGSLRAWHRRTAHTRACTRERSLQEVSATSGAALSLGAALALATQLSTVPTATAIEVVATGPQSSPLVGAQATTLLAKLTEEELAALPKLKRVARPSKPVPPSARLAPTPTPSQTAAIAPTVDATSPSQSSSLGGGIATPLASTASQASPVIVDGYRYVVNAVTTFRPPTPSEALTWTVTSSKNMYTSSTQALVSFWQGSLLAGGQDFTSVLFYGSFFFLLTTLTLAPKN